MALLPEIGPIEDVHLLRAIHEGLKRVSTPEESRQIYRRTNSGWCCCQSTDVRHHDPYVPASRHNGIELACEPDLDRALTAADCAVVTDHSRFD